MKIHDIINKPFKLMLTNEESDFIQRYGSSVAIPSLPDRDRELIRTMVIKGVYNQTKINNTVELNVRERN